ncbi:MAG: histidine phosphatase family protein [Alphaproteobacteria bacterium]
MTRLALLRHGRTAWNDDGRLQGRTDVALTEAGKALLRAVRVPAAWREAAWYVSPLRRCVESADCLGIAATVEERLIEMSFGTFEGKTLAQLRDDPDLDMAALEDGGLDFMPPGGESPRQVQDRVRGWLAEIAGGPDIGALTHKGVIRALYAAARDWPMLGKPPDKLRWDRLHVFEVGPGGALAVHELNVAMDQA